MKAALLVGMLALATILYAQAPGSSTAPVPSPSPAANQTSTPAFSVSSGVVLSTELIRGLDARKAQPGDPVVVKCAQDLTVNGEVLIPRNAKLIGHVVAVQTKGRGKPESLLAIAFEKAVMRDGRELPLTATVQSLVPPETMADEVGDTDFRIRNLRTANPRPTALLPGIASTPTHALTANRTGVTRLEGLQLEAVPATETSVIHSDSRNIRLESGTRLSLRVSFP